MTSECIDTKVRDDLGDVERKYCEGCKTVKQLETGFYKAAKSWQKYCIPCHNNRRSLYFRSEKKPQGFQKLSKEIRDDILYDISIKILYKKIATKYDINYGTLCGWKRNGLIK